MFRLTTSETLQSELNCSLDHPGVATSVVANQVRVQTESVANQKESDNTGAVMLSAWAWMCLIQSQGCHGPGPAPFVRKDCCLDPVSSPLLCAVSKLLSWRNSSGYLLRLDGFRRFLWVRDCASGLFWNRCGRHHFCYSFRVYRGGVEGLFLEGGFQHCRSCRGKPSGAGTVILCWMDVSRVAACSSTAHTSSISRQRCHSISGPWVTGCLGENQDL